MLDSSVHRRGGTQRRANVNFHQPRFEIAVDQDIEAVQLKAAGAFVLGLGVDVKHNRFCADAGLDDNILDLFEQLREAIGTLSASTPVCA